MKNVSFIECFCKEAKEFLEDMKQIDKAFCLNYSILNPIEINDSQITIFFKSLKQTITPIKKIIDEQQDDISII